ncbi:probable elongation factor 1-delta isoform X2 [Phymastichus coffea]|uniref:probable elongation factor 1-delta isoform X2 n=1 Tax=Phymastichus coffea TaxID=108790 RepID=UPI00273A81BA|nr:probable elongation factor 1-delta isoform X2 [Phymastichus coffea]XP_058798069.1 probable elongation factor 1-delta isoform X2 [Phymastichus coffea]XP_058798070.1 probable elongation factor 1-delta isoform X2 [Phymastichus coffea]
MAGSALAQEKVWLDKSSYDKAECIYQEKLAKVQPSKIVDDISTTYKPTPIEIQATMISNSVPKTKSKKTKDNKLIAQENVTSETTKNSKNLKKNSKKKEENVSECNKNYEIANNVNIKSEDSNISIETISNKKSKNKEAKEKKPKGEKKIRNLEEKNVIEDNKEQLNNQGSQPSVCSISPAGGSLADEVAKARQHIKQSLQCMDGIAALAGISDKDVVSRLVALEKENQELRNIVQELKSTISKLDNRVKTLEGQSGQAPKSSAPAPVAPAKPAKKEEEEDEDVDLFGSDSEGEDAEAAKIREERLAAYAAKKSKKPALIAKSNIILDIKPWDDETDMKAMEAEVRKIKADGLLWGAAKLAPVAYNIQKLQISCVVEDDKVSIDWLTEQIQEIDFYVQSVDIAAFNKI